MYAFYQGCLGRCHLCSPVHSSHAELMEECTSPSARMTSSTQWPVRESETLHWQAIGSKTSLVQTSNFPFPFGECGGCVFGWLCTQSKELRFLSHRMEHSCPGADWLQTLYQWEIHFPCFWGISYWFWFSGFKILRNVLLQQQRPCLTRWIQAASGNDAVMLRT